ncbi:uncharacterized protein LOC128274864 [Anopheles cruzii]|uniref:uncharacterized protein LOC128274864 n=1 Tax=Anopheles cruzii TaxID=68878 RepID=UPI0022EC6660|nr:uncharacterized protein LOC128274864 [Anopheles cruzii]
MVSPSKAKLSRIASQQPPPPPQRKSTTSSKPWDNKVKLVKGPKPLIHHRFFLDIERHQIAAKIESTIKQLGGSIEFFLSENITHFITDKYQHQPRQVGSGGGAAATGEQRPEERLSLATPGGGSASSSSLITQAQARQSQQRSGSRQLLAHQHQTSHQQPTRGQYVNDIAPATSRTSSPCPPPPAGAAAAAAAAAPPSPLATVQQQQQQQAVVAFEGAASSSAGGGCSTSIASATTTTTLGFDGRVKATHPAVPRSRADAMLQCVRQQQQRHQHQYHTSSHQQQQQQQPSYHLLHSSPLNYQSPTPPAATAIIGSTPTKRRSETTSPFTFYSSSHHKQQPQSSSCHSPATPASVEQQVGVPATAPPTPKHQNSPIPQLASSWGTPVWSPEQALKFLRKVLDSVRNENHPQQPPLLGGTRGRATAGTAGGRTHRHHHPPSSASVRSRHVHHLKGRFLKIESASNPGQHRPFYQEFKRWPDLLLRHPEAGKKAPFADVHEQPPPARLVAGGTTGQTAAAARTGSPFDRMTRKVPAGRNITAKSGGASAGDPKNVKKRGPPQQQDEGTGAGAGGGQQKPVKDCGYCEICRIEYDSLAVHVESDSHRGFVQNDGNFLSLDRLIGSIGEAAGDQDQEAAVGGWDDDGGGAAVDLRDLFLQQTQGTGREDALDRPLKLAAAEEAPAKPHYSSETTKGKQTIDTEETEDTGKETDKNLIVAPATTTPKPLSVPRKSAGGGGGGLVGGRECATNVGQAKRKRSTTTTEGKSKATKAKCSSGGEFAGDFSEPTADEDEDRGNTTAELIRLAISSVVSSFEGDNESGDKRESTVRSKNNRKTIGSGQSIAGGGPPAASVSEELVALSNRSSYNQHKLDPDRDREEGNSVQRAPTIREPVSRTRGRGAKSARGRQERRYSNRLAAAASATEEVTTTEEPPAAECSLGMFGRRSAIHHHPHNQLSHHHKHQKHKPTTLSAAAFLPKQQEQPFREPELETCARADSESAAVVISGSDHQQQHQQQPQDGGNSFQQSSDDGHHDDAVGMKVISDFRHEPQQQQPQVELKKKAAPTATTNVLMVAGIDGEPLVKQHPAVAGRRKKRRVVGPKATEERGTQKQPSREQESTMGLKASTAAMNKHHHLPHDAGGGGGGVGAAAAAAAAALLECEGLDPKNTKRISLGLRQNPKRANLNEDFTSLLDETLERSRMGTPAGSITTTVSTGCSVSARKAQSRIRHGGGGQKAKEKAEKKVHGTITASEHSPSAVSAAMTAAAPGEAKRMAKKNASAAALETIKVRGIRWRAPSPTTRPPVKSPLLYKVIDPASAAGTTAASSRMGSTIEESTATERRKSSATAATGATPISPNQRRSSAKSKQQHQLPTKNGLIVKIRRVRQSELSLLNDEAENFMFPKKDESSSDADTDDDRQTSSEGFRHQEEGHRTATVANYSIDLQSSSECELAKQEDDDDDDDEATTSRKRKKPGSHRVDSVESEPSSTSSSSFAVAPSAKRARLDPKATSKARRKAAGDEQQDDRANLEKVVIPEQDAEEVLLEKPVAARPIELLELDTSAARGSPSLTAPFACTCYGVSAANRSRGRGCGRGGSRRGRRGRGGAGGGRWATRGRGRMPLCVCRMQSLDATRMPPPAAVGGGEESQASSVTVTPAGRKSGASKTKTTPPLPKPRRGGAVGTAKEQHYLSAGSSVATLATACGSSSSCGPVVVGKGKEDGMGAVFKWINFRKRCEEIEPYRFAFERVPSLEPWYETFQRQDDGTEKVYEYFGSTGYRKLPYEMGPLPALSQNCCILNYKVVACRKSNRNAASSQPTSSSSSSMEPPSPGKQRGGAAAAASGSGTSTNRSGGGGAGEVGDLDTKKSPSSSALSSLPLKKRKLLLQQEQSAAASGSSTGTSTSVDGGSTSTGTSGSRIARLIAGSDRPRKSPREHASTLAILSLLSQQQHRKRAAAIKILTSPKKATTTTAQSLLATRSGHDADSGSAENNKRRPSSATDCAANGGNIKFEKPLFPDSNYVNSRTLCQELDAFLSGELEQVCGGRSTPTTVLATAGVKKELLDDEDEEGRLPSPRPSTSELHSSECGTKIKEESDADALHLTLPPSVLRHGVAIERHHLPVSKRDLVDVLQTVGTEPPLSLKLVQRCETVLKKIVQFDRKPRSMLSSNGGFGPTVGLRLFEGGSSRSPVCGGGVGHGGGTGAGGSFLKKRINRTGWPTNKRKIGTRTRQQLRLGSKETETEVSVEENSEDEKAATQEQPGAVVDDEEVDQPVDDADDDDDASEEEEEDEEEDEEDDDGVETVIEDRSPPRRQRGGPCRKHRAAQSSINSSHVVVVSHEKTHHRGTVRPQENGPVEEQQEVVLVEGKEEDRSCHSETREQPRGRRRRKSSSASVAKQQQPPPPEVSGDRGQIDDDKQEAADIGEPRRPMLFDSMPTLRAALMRDNSSQLLQKPHGSVPLPSSLLSPTSSVPKHPSDRSSESSSAVESERRSSCSGSSSSVVPPPAGNRGPTGNPTTGGGKYVTKTTTTMTRVDYDGASGHPVQQVPNTKSPSSKRKSGDGGAHQEESASASRPLGDGGTVSVEPVVTVRTGQQQRHQRSVPEDDDKECDSISSRSIFVSDDCDTTSSSTFVITEETTGSQQHHHHRVDPRLEEHRRKEESSENEDEEDEDEEEQDEQLLLVATAESGSSSQRQRQQRRRDGSLNHRSPRTPSERIRNKMVKNRRMALLNRRLATTVAVAPSRTTVVKLSPAKLTVPTITNTTQSTQTILAKRRTQQPASLPPPPPVMMMPLSPPLTTSTSSSSSSSCADDKPMSPAAATTVVSGVSSKEDAPVPESLVTPTVVAVISPPSSKVKTRSSSKRGGGRSATTTAGRGRRTYRAAATNTGLGTKDTLFEAATTIPIPYVRLVKTPFPIGPLSPAEPPAPLEDSPSAPAPKGSPSRRVKKSASRVKCGRRRQLQVVEPEAEAEEQAVPVKKRRKKQHIVLKEEPADDDLPNQNARRPTAAPKEPESATVMECGRDKCRSLTPPPRGKRLKLKVLNHTSSHFTYETLSLAPFVVENGVDNPDSDDDDDQDQDDDVNVPAVMSPVHQVDIEQLLEEHLVEEVKGGTVDEEDDPEDERIEMLELMEVEDDHDDDDGDHLMANNRHGVEDGEEPDEDAFLTGDEVELEEEDDARAVVNRITNDDHPYANSSSDDHRRYQINRHHQHHHHHRRHESGQSTDEGEDSSPEYVEVEELEVHDDVVLEEANDLEEEQLAEEEEHEEEEEDTDEDDSGTTEEVIHHHHVVQDSLRKYPAPGRGTVVPVARHNKVTSPNEGHVVVPASSSTTTLVSPNKYSPRKLRKPRGRWYRER